MRPAVVLDLDPWVRRSLVRAGGVTGKSDQAKRRPRRNLGAGRFLAAVSNVLSMGPDRCVSAENHWRDGPIVRIIDPWVRQL